MDVSGLEPNHYEDLLGTFESDAAPVFQQVVSTQRIPKDLKPRSILVSFLALLATRTLAAQSLLGRVASATTDRAMAELATPEGFERACEALVAAGRPDPRNEITAAEMRTWLETKPTVELPKPFMMVKMLQAQTWVFPDFASRYWQLAIIEDDGEFVTSDHPVSVQWVTGEVAEARGRAATFADSQTELFFPLSTKLAILGLSEHTPFARRHVNREFAAARNSRTALNGMLYALAASENPPFKIGDRYGLGAEVLPLLKENPPSIDSFRGF